MKRFSIFAILFMTLLFASLPMRVSGQTVIYKGMSSVDLIDGESDDPGMSAVAAVVGLGSTTVTDFGDGNYMLKVTAGEETLIADFMDDAKVVNNRKVTFRYILSDGQVTTISMTPKELDLGGMLRVILTDDAAFPGLVKAIRANNSKSPGKSSVPSSVPSGTASGSSDLTPVDAVRYPFGFLPPETERISDALSLLRQAGWKADITRGAESEMIYVVSYDQFRIPYRMFGKAVTAMEVWGWTPPGNIMNYEVEINDLKQNWTADDAETFAKRIVEELKSAGYAVVGPSHLGKYDFYKYELTGNGLTVTVSASEGSKEEWFDAYVVRLRMEKNKQ